LPIKLPDASYENSKQTVVNTLSIFGIRGFPINPFELAKRMGIVPKAYSTFPTQVKELMLKTSEDGFSTGLDNGKWDIFYNDEGCDATRINYTIAHELGHIIVDHHTTSEVAEAEANFFGAYLLVPIPLVHVLGLTETVEIQSVFNVGFQVARNSLNRYNKWLTCNEKAYLSYEIQLLQHFGYHQESRQPKKTSLVS